MIPEIQLGVNFIVINFLVNKLPKRKVSMFAKELTECLKLKFKGHWYPNYPDRGTAFRCLEIRDTAFDPVLVHAARVSGITLTDIRAQLPESFFLWVDPFEVSYRIGENGSLSILKRFNPETYQYDQQIAPNPEDLRIPLSWDNRGRQNKCRNVVRSQVHQQHHRHSNNSESSNDSDYDARSRSPDLQDLVNVQPFVPRSNSSPVPQHYQQQQSQQYLQSQFLWKHPLHQELVTVQ